MRPEMNTTQRTVAFRVLLRDVAYGADAIGNAAPHAQTDHIVIRRLQQASEDRI